MASSYTLRVLGAQGECRPSEFRFHPGEELMLTLQLVNNTCPGCLVKESIPEDAVKTLSLPGTPDDIVIADGDILVNSSDPSIFMVEITPEMSTAMITGSILFEFSSVLTGETRKAYLPYGIKKMTTPFEC